MTKYCLLDCGDIIGPFLASELLARRGFGPHSLICPEEHTAEGTYWKEAYLYEEFNFQEEKMVEKAAETLLTIPLDQLQQSEIDKASAALSGRPAEPITSRIEKPAEPLVVEEKTVSQENPIEEYFNTMREGDLGNILGIPDKTNSDLDLARVLEKQFAKTDPHLMEKPVAAEKDPFDEFVAPTAAAAKPASAGESVPTVSAEALDAQTAASLSKEINAKESAQAAQMPVLPNQAEQQMPVLQTDVPHVDKKETQDISEPISSSSARVIAPSKPPVSKKWYVMFVGGVVALVLSLGVLVSAVSHHEEEEKTTPDKAETVARPVTMPEKTPLMPAVQTTAPTESISSEELAQNIVKHYVLDEERGTVEQYLAKRYAQEIASGYAYMWAAEPLHRNSYVVRYRLVKARTEPIVYVFQVDTVKKKLTGALNNITLDLVGKINS